MTASRHVVRQADAADADALTRILAAGFYEDPPLAWILPDLADRERLSPAFFRPFVDLVLSGGQAYVTEDLTGASLWLDVDVTANDDDPEALRQHLVDGLGAEYAKRFFVLDELLSAGHPMQHSHAYLLFAGVLPELQSQGIGTAVLSHRLTQLDGAGQPAYLEASSDRNSRLYARLGFAPVGDQVTMPQGPVLTPMWRSPSV